MANPAYEYIDSNAALLEACMRWQQVKVLAMDTEFIRVSTFFPKPGLFQVNDGEQISLIDPLVIDQWQPFQEVLQSSGVVKVFHACDEDIELFYHFLGVKTQAVFDTQVAAAFCGFDYSMGYQRLVESVFDVLIPKQSSRSDWLQRPLTETQCEYAAADVDYLFKLYPILLEKLQDNGFLYAVNEEYQAVLAGICSEDYSQAYLRIKRAQNLRPKALSVLKKLAAWRELTMREQDLPRNRIASNDALLRMATMHEVTEQKLFHVNGLPKTIASQYQQQLLELIELAKKSSDSDLAALPIDKLRLQKIKQSLQQVAAEHGVAEQMLSKKLYNEALAKCSSADALACSTINDWRQPFYQQALAQMV